MEWGQTQGNPVALLRIALCSFQLWLLPTALRDRRPPQGLVLQFNVEEEQLQLLL
jgi:hypothetical protein